MDSEQIKLAKHINLEELRTMLEEDNIVEKMLTEFVNKSPVDIENLNTAVSLNDYTEIATIAHKLKSSFKHFGIASSQEIGAIETLANGKESIKIIGALLSVINKDYNAAIEDAKKILG